MYVFLQAYERGARPRSRSSRSSRSSRATRRSWRLNRSPVIDGLDAKSKAVPVRFSIPLDGLITRPLRLSGQRARANGRKGRLLAGADRDSALGTVANSQLPIPNSQRVTSNALGVGSWSWELSKELCGLADNPYMHISGARTRRLAGIALCLAAHHGRKRPLGAKSFWQELPLESPLG